MAVTHQTGQTPVDRTGVAAAARRSTPAMYVMAILRIVIGFTFLWAFFDKVFGWGHATPAAKSWLNGGSPTKGFLSASEGPFAGFYHHLAGTTFANWAFMLGLLGIGLALTLGIGMRIAGVTGVLLYLMMWAVVLPPETNPIVDDHIIGALAVAALALTAAGDTLGLGRWWKRQPVVENNPWLS
jgi:thiosulfate dehydrogenase [quinone] large subunit